MLDAMTQTTRRRRTAASIAIALAVICLANLVVVAEPNAAPAASTQSAAKRPNVLLIITDDQGWGDLGCHGNQRIRTPNLDRLAADGLEMTRFYVSPVCAPTRASLLTGRYNYRTGVVDTYRGRAMMHADEVTLAEMLAAGGYRTGIFGKWHLGDNYPLRACDQGFAESLVHGGGGIVQPADPPQGNHYQDPWLWRNGRLEQTRGYCSDVYTDAAIDFIQRRGGQPFFVYLAFNCPHLPLEVRAGDDTSYRAAGLDDVTAKVYGMVTNIDENIGRLLATLDETQLADNTIVIFLTDNGPQQDRYNGQMRGRKSNVYDGGIRVPLLVRWPGRLERGRKLDTVAAHIDITPTLLAACDVAAPPGLKFDGVNLLPLWSGDDDARRSALDDRTIFIQTHRGDVPELGRNCTAIGPRWKLVQGAGWREGALADSDKKFELFDMLADPRELRDRAADEPTVLAELMSQYEAWFRDVEGTRHFAPPRIHVGTPRENPTLLTRQECRGNDPGHWLVEIAPGRYDIKLIVAPAAVDRTAAISLPQPDGEATLAAPLPADATKVLLARGVELVGGPFALSPYVESRFGARTGVRYLEIQRTDLQAESIPSPR